MPTGLPAPRLAAVRKLLFTRRRTTFVQPGGSPESVIENFELLCRLAVAAQSPRTILPPPFRITSCRVRACAYNSLEKCRRFCISRVFDGRFLAAAPLTRFSGEWKANGRWIFMRGSLVDSEGAVTGDALKITVQRGSSPPKICIA